MDRRLYPFVLAFTFFIPTSPLLSGFEEPYPAIMTPGFPGAGSGDPAVLAMERTEVFAEFVYAHHAQPRNAHSSQDERFPSPPSCESDLGSHTAGMWLKDHPRPLYSHT
jgi:hypothetical protein